MIILSHLGLGDHIICIPIIRHYAKLHDEVVVPCWQHNENAVRWFYSDLHNVVIRPVASPDEVIHADLRLGCYNDSFDKLRWEQEFYRHAALPFVNRWRKFYLPPFDIPNINHPFAFVHDDARRGYAIDDAKLPQGMQVYRPSGIKSFAEEATMMYAATEIHVIDSAFLCLADSVNHRARRVWHRYARTGGDSIPPTLGHLWEIY